MEQRTDRGGAFHGIGQPGQEWKLGALAHHAAKNKEGGEREEVGGNGMSLGGLVHFENAQVAEAQQKNDQSQEEADIAETGHYKGFFASLRGAPFFIIEADQQIRCEPDQFPENEELDHTGRDHHAHHGPGKQRLKGVIPAVAGITRHVTHRVDLYEETDGRHDGEHEEAEWIEEIPERNQQLVRQQPGKFVLHGGPGAVQGHQEVESAEQGGRHRPDGNGGGESLVVAGEDQDRSHGKKRQTGGKGCRQQYRILEERYHRMLSLQLLSPFHVDRMDPSKQRQDDAQADGSLRCSQAHNEQRNDLPHRRFRREEAIKSHEIDVGPVQHQFDGNQHADKVPSKTREMTSNTRS